MFEEKVGSPELDGSLGFQVFVWGHRDFAPLEPFHLNTFAKFGTEVEDADIRSLRQVSLGKIGVFLEKRLDGSAKLTEMSAIGVRGENEFRIEKGATIEVSRFGRNRLDAYIGYLMK